MKFVSGRIMKVYYDKGMRWVDAVFMEMWEQTMTKGWAMGRERRNSVLERIGMFMSGILGESVDRGTKI